MAKQTKVAWNNPANTANLDHIEIWRKIGALGTFEKIGTNINTITASTPLFYIDNNSGVGLADGQQYFYDVRTYNSTGGFTSIQNSITISGILIAPPTALTVGTPTVNTLPLTWTKSVTGIMTEYRVYRNNVLLQTFVGDVASGTLTGLTAATAYSLTVRGYNGSSESANSNVVIGNTANDVVAPTMIFAYVPNSNPDTIIVKFSEVVTAVNANFVSRTVPSNTAATSVAGSGTDTLTFTFATPITVELLAVKIAFATGHVVKDLSGNLFNPGAPVDVVNMILGTGADLSVAGAHSRVGEVNSIAMFTGNNANITVETTDVFDSIYAAKITAATTSGSVTRGVLLVNVSDTKKYKGVCWAKKVGGVTDGTLSPLDASATFTSAKVKPDGIWRPYSWYSNLPGTNANANLSLFVGSGTVDAGTYLLIDKFSFNEYI